MNDKDKEAFEKWWKEYTSNLSVTPTEWDVHDAWQAAVQYKQKEYSNIMDAMTQTSQNNAKLVAENKKLREALERFIFAHEVGGCKTEYDGAFKDAREALKDEA